MLVSIFVDSLAGDVLLERTVSALFWFIVDLIALGEFGFLAKALGSRLHISPSPRSREWS